MNARKMKLRLPKLSQAIVDDLRLARARLAASDILTRKGPEEHGQNVAFDFALARRPGGSLVTCDDEVSEPVIELSIEGALRLVTDEESSRWLPAWDALVELRERERPRHLDWRTWPQLCDWEPTLPEALSLIDRTLKAGGAT